MLSLLFSLLIANPAAAARPSGYELGNGGFFIQCTSQSSLGAGVFSVDRIEGEKLHGLKSSPELAKFATESELVQHVIGQLGKINPSRAARFTAWYNELSAKRVFIKDLYIESVKDGNVTLVPPGCESRQAAVFVAEPGSENIRFLFDQDLWTTASVLDRAYLVLHELIYREALLPQENLHRNSMASRYLNAFLFANAENLNQDQWIKALRDLKFRTADYKNSPISLTRIDFSGRVLTAPLLYFANSSAIQKAVLPAAFNIKVGAKTYSRTCVHEEYTQSLFTDYVEFYPEGNVKRFVFDKGRSNAGCEGFDGKNDLEFDEAGNLIRASSVTPAPYWTF